MPFFGSASSVVKNTLSLILLITALQKLGAHLNRKYLLENIPL
jgi:hypothetical protein